MVYVINKQGQALMPTERFGKVRRLLKNGLAHVMYRIPFTIQLDYDTTNFIQPISLGIDAGSKHIGISATTSEKELYAADVELRNDIVEKLSTRREQRRTRRNRLRYRRARFNNRVSSKRKGWLAPSIENKIQTHLTVVEKIHKFLPITNIIVETAALIYKRLRIQVYQVKNINKENNSTSLMCVSMCFIVMVISVNIAKVRVKTLS